MADLNNFHLNLCAFQIFRVHCETILTFKLNNHIDAVMLDLKKFKNTTKKDDRRN